MLWLLLKKVEFKKMVGFLHAMVVVEEVEFKKMATY
jgi:hypothetical protein